MDQEMTTFPALRPEFVDIPTIDRLTVASASTHPPRILLLYGSLRERSYSRFLVQEAALILERLGAETRIFDPRDLPMPDAAPAEHPKVQDVYKRQHQHRPPPRLSKNCGAADRVGLDQATDGLAIDDLGCGAGVRHERLIFLSLIHI